MSSIFFSSTEKIEAIHINLWNLKSDECILDLGFHLKKSQEIEIFIPFEIRNELIQDLQPKMFKEHDLIRSIFNEHVSVNSSSSQDFCTVKMQNREKEFDVCQSSVEHSLEDGFSRIKLKSKDSPVNDEIYLRIRLILNDHIKEIIKEYIRKDYFLNPFKECITYIDFRINEIRFAKGKIYSELTEKIMIVENIHYFVVKKLDDALVIESPASARSRLLGEEDIWLNYLDKTSSNGKKITESLIAYHWKDTENIDAKKHYGFLSGFEYKRPEKKKIIIYFLIIIGIGIITNILTDFIIDRFKNDNCQKIEMLTPKNVTPSYKPQIKK
jgi:hypothetical protein